MKAHAMMFEVIRRRKSDYPLISNRYASGSVEHQEREACVQHCVHVAKNNLPTKELRSMRGNQQAVFVKDELITSMST